MRGAEGPVNSCQDLLRRVVVLWPNARSFSITARLGLATGSDPAEYARKRAPPHLRRRASAMSERAALWVHRNRTLKAGVIPWFSSGKEESSCAKSPQSSGRPPQQVSVRKP